MINQLAKKPPQGQPLSRPRTLTDEVAQQLTDKILNQELKVGESLPTEKQLAESYAVSRTVIREGISRLKCEGLIETRQGRSAVVRFDGVPRSFKVSNEKLLSETRLKDIYALRIAVETEAAALAAIQCTEKQLKELRIALNAIKSAINHDETGVSEDVSFHSLIAKATGNPIFQELISFLGANIKESIRIARNNSRKSRQLPEQVQLEHEAILQAIIDRDPNIARRAMRHHLEMACARLWPNKSKTKAAKHPRRSSD